MKFAPVLLADAKGKILGHNIAGETGQRLLRKGKPLTEDDLEKLRILGRTSVYVAEMEPDDVDENKAARRLPRRFGMDCVLRVIGRPAFRDMEVLRVDVDRPQINECNGITSHWHPLLVHQDKCSDRKDHPLCCAGVNPGEQRRLQ
jgi:molybdenum cofactor cytidylyltransferase